MLICYDNLFIQEHTVVSPAIVIGAEPGSTFVMKSGSFEDNLLFEDPYLRFQATMTGADDGVWIEFHMTDSTNATSNIVFGLWDWLDPMAFDTVELQFGITASGPWIPLTTVDLTGIVSIPPGSQNRGWRNMLFRWGGGSGVDYRFMFMNSAAPRDFDLSNIVMFKAFEVAQNPDTGKIVQTTTRPSLGRRAAGGALHLARAGRKQSEGMQLTWSAADKDLSGFLGYVDDRFGDQLVGVVQPEQAANAVGTPISLPHYIGRASSFRTTAHHRDGLQEHVHSMTWVLEGAR